LLCFQVMFPREIFTVKHKCGILLHATISNAIITSLKATLSKLKSYLIISNSIFWVIDDLKILKNYPNFFRKFFWKILNVVWTNFLADFLWLSWTWFITAKHISWKIKIRTKLNRFYPIQIWKCLYEMTVMTFFTGKMMHSKVTKIIQGQLFKRNPECEIAFWNWSQLHILTSAKLISFHYFAAK